MGLFSKQKAAAPSDIPEEILRSVSVNGERRIEKVVMPPKETNQASVAETTSPFLNRTSATEVKTDAATPISNTKENTEEVAPKPFSFADQEVSPEAIRFINSDGGAKEEEEKKVPDFSRVTEEPSVRSAKSALAEKMGESTGQIFWTRGNILSIGIFFVILGLISGGSWYYLNTRSAIGDTSVESMSESSGGSELEAALEENSNLTIATDEANKLPLDVESVTIDGVRAAFAEEMIKINGEEVVVPVEYLVTDLNDNRLAFSRFALLSRANVPDTLVNVSKEPFSLYLYQDGGVPRVALAVALGEGTEEVVKGGMSNVAQSFKDLLLTPEQAAVLPSTLTFNEATYNGQKIYYYNVEEASATSFDITFDDGYMIIANSKNTLRAVFDKRN